jgi:hypothetical protein
MTANSKLMISEAEHRFPVRIRLALPAAGLGERLNQMHEWLDQSAGADGWAMTPSSTRGVVNDAVAVYFADATIASGFVASGVPGRGSRRAMASSRCGTMSRRRSDQHATTRGRCETRKSPVASR